jgi:hypothetical protein
MSTEDNPKKPIPSAAEINAYLELSAARTKKRLPLAFGKTPAVKPAPVPRKLKLTGAATAADPSAPASPRAEADDGETRAPSSTPAKPKG